MSSVVFLVFRVIVFVKLMLIYYFFATKGGAIYGRENVKSG